MQKERVVFSLGLLHYGQQESYKLILMIKNIFQINEGDAHWSHKTIWLMIICISSRYLKRHIFAYLGRDQFGGP